MDNNKYQQGQLIECLWRDKEYYNATIHKAYPNQTYDVKFVDDEYRRYKVPEAQIRPYEPPSDPSILPPTPLTSDKARPREEVEVAFGQKRPSDQRRKSSAKIDASSYLTNFRNLL